MHDGTKNHINDLQIWLNPRLSSTHSKKKVLTKERPKPPEKTKMQNCKKKASARLAVAKPKAKCDYKTSVFLSSLPSSFPITLPPLFYSYITPKQKVQK